MFERVKAYKRLYKSNKFLRGCKIFAEMTENDVMLKAVNETLYLNEKLKKSMWLNRKLAERYNLESIKNGL